MALSSAFGLAEAGRTQVVPIDPEFATTTLVRAWGTFLGAPVIIIGQLGGAEVQLSLVNVSSGVVTPEITAEGVYRVDTAGLSGILGEAELGFSGLANLQFSVVLG